MKAMKTREQLEAQERDLAGQQRNQAEFLVFCRSVPMADPGARSDLIQDQQGKLREIEEQLARVRKILSRLPVPAPTAAPTHS